MFYCTIIIDYEFIELHCLPHGILFIIASTKWQISISLVSAASLLDLESIERYHELLGILQFVPRIIICF